jgi:hypothetical protein
MHAFTSPKSFHKISLTHVKYYFLSFPIIVFQGNLLSEKILYHQIPYRA